MAFAATGVFVALGRRWFNKVEGLCGNYDGNRANDFDVPHRGFYAQTPSEFGGFWKAVGTCPDGPDEEFDPCVVRV